VWPDREKEWMDTLKRVDWKNVQDIEIPYWCWQRIPHKGGLKVDLLPDHIKTVEVNETSKQRWTRILGKNNEDKK
jgi:hypothetical protein